MPGPKSDEEGPGASYRLVYKSTASLGLRGLPARTEIENIVERSRAGNAASSITSVLVLKNGFFVQYLEGPAEAVEATFERISVDVRHHDLVVLRFETAPMRLLPGRPLVFVELTPGEGGEETIAIPEIAEILRPFLDGPAAARTDE